MKTTVKTCFKCKESKPLDRFYRHPMMVDGRFNKCKECARRDARETRKLKIDYYRQYDRARGSRTNGNKSRRKKPEAHKAHQAVSNALRAGRLVKPNGCEECESHCGPLHGHHDDYSCPLEVIWLCVPCHKARHKKLGWGYVWNEGLDNAA